MSPQRRGVDNDIERAERLVAGLEIVSDELVRRYEKLRAGEGDATEGCAICRDNYLAHYESNHADFYMKFSLSNYPDFPTYSEREQNITQFKLLPFHPSPYQVLVFPCPGRHLFHVQCLEQWLARKTTCPSCRYDIDPHSLTLRQTGTTSLYARGMGKWEPPAVSRLEEWLTNEEMYKEGGSRPECSHAPTLERSSKSSHMGHTFADHRFPGQERTGTATQNHRGRWLNPYRTFPAPHGDAGAARSSFHLSSLPRASARPAGSSVQRPRATVSQGRPPILAQVDLASFMLHVDQTRVSASMPPASPPRLIFPELMPDDDGASDDELPALVE